jgi:putative peptide zinc metalloprotease protein
MGIFSESTPDFGTGRLQLRRDLRCSLQECSGQPYYLVEDPARSKFYRIGVREWAFVAQLSGGQTIPEALARSSAQLGADALTGAEAASLGQWLLSTQLAELKLDQGGAAGTTPAPNRLAGAAEWLNPFFIKIPLFNPDPLLARLLPWTWWLLTRPAVLVWLLVCLAGGQAVALHWNRFAEAASGVLAPDNWLYLIVAWIGLKTVHELFHGLVCRRFGGSVPRAGIVLILFSPVAFVDVTSAWRFRSKWHRIYTSAAGMYVEFFIAAVAALLWSRTEPGVVNQLCHNLVLMASVTTLLFNGNPLMRFDGYYIFTDLVEIQNLYPTGQQYVRYLGRRYVCGVRTAQPPRMATRAGLIRIYALASLVWRWLLYVSLALAAASLFHGAGLVLTILAVILWMAIPAVRLARYLCSASEPDRPSRVRFAGVLVGTAAVLGVVLALPWPGGVRAPAVVEYAPLTVVRTDGPGFVTQVCVEPGQVVSRGTLLAVLARPEIEVKLAELDLAIQKSLLKSRIHHNDHELDKYLVEERNRVALEEQRDELAKQVHRLKLRAPTAGRVVGRQLDALVGRYLEAGETLLTLGREESKELQVSVSQEDVDLLLDRIGELPRVRIKGQPGRVRQGTLARINPRATTVLPHDALAAPAGGPLAVKSVPKTEETAGDKADHFELLAPRFTAVVELSREDALQLRAGELALVRVASADATIGRYLFGTIRTWWRRKLEPQAVAQVNLSALPGVAAGHAPRELAKRPRSQLSHTW